MEWLSREQYEKLPWAGGGPGFFLKPRYEEIAPLKTIPLANRDSRYSEFYELDTYLSIASGIKPGHMLDAGAGCGSLSYLFTHLGWRVISTDFDRSAFQFHKGQFVHADLNKRFPFRSKTFDLVVCKQVIEHLENPNYLIKEVTRILKPGGTCILSTPNITSLLARIRFFFSGYPAFYEGYWKDHRTILHYEQLKSMFEENGVEQISYYTNRHELFSFSAEANGRRMRLISPLVRLLCRDNSPEACKYGQLIIMKATKR